MAFKFLWPFGQKQKKTTPKKKADGSEYSSQERVVVPVNHLRLGMYVAELDRPWVDTSFIFQGFEIKTEEELRAIRDTCHHVYVDTTKGRKIAAPPTPSFKRVVATEEKSLDVNNYGTPPKKLGVFEKEFFRAEKNYENAELVVSNFMRTIENGGGIDSVLAQSAVAACVESILHSPDAMIIPFGIKTAKVR